MFIQQIYEMLNYNLYIINVYFNFRSLCGNRIHCALIFNKQVHTCHRRFIYLVCI